jgi:hypothetical protein
MFVGWGDGVNIPLRNMVGTSPPSICVPEGVSETHIVGSLDVAKEKDTVGTIVGFDEGIIFGSLEGIEDRIIIISSGDMADGGSVGSFDGFIVG